MAKHKVSMNFSPNKFSDSEFLIVVGYIVEKMTNNAHFPEPVPDLEEVADAQTAYGDALDKSVGGSRADTAVKKQQKARLTTLIKQLATYVQEVSGGDAAIILSSGFDMHQKHARVGGLPKATGLRIQMGANRGSVMVSCQVIKKAHMYIFEYATVSEVGEPDWQTLITTRHKLLIEGLTSGQQYTFRVAGAATDTSRNWSDQVQSYVL